MILAFQLSDLVTVPFGWLLSVLYDLTSNYGIAMILFGIIVQMVLMPITAKSKKSTMKMSRLTPQLQDIQRRYASDPQKQNELMQQLYKEEGVSMGGGCLWSLVPMLILFPLFAVIRQPIVYMLHEDLAVAEQIVATIKGLAPNFFSNNTYYDQVTAAQLIPTYAEALRAAIPGISEATLAGVNFDFFGINLGAIPQFNVFRWNVWDWAHIGAFLIPILSAASQYLQMFIMQKENNSLVTNEDGVHDSESAKNSQSNQSMKGMMYTMPLMSLWIGFTVPAGLSVYWFIGGLVRMISDPIMTKHYRKIYDEEDKIRIQRMLEREKEEAEKERVRAERRAANPDGQTQNTSKKKLQQKQRAEEEAARIAAAKEYNAKRGIVEEAPEEKQTLSGIPERPYCKGRAYKADRYGSHTTEE